VYSVTLDAFDPRSRGLMLTITHASMKGRRATKAQRQAITRMTDRGYAMPKEILANFSRVNNGAERALEEQEFKSVTVEELNCWRRNWLNQAFGVIEQNARQEITHLAPHPFGDDIPACNEKYRKEVESMFGYTNPLDHRAYHEIWLEIGFGSGVNMIANAKLYPNNLFIGAEVHQPGIGSLLGQLESEASVGNLRVVPGDGIRLLSILPDRYLDRILITFPDPWPKDRHAAWRVIQSDVLRQMQRVLKLNGLAFVATDAQCFDDWTTKIFGQESNWKRVIPCPDRAEWLPVVSYYERKGIDEGRSTRLQCWQIV